jgi:hypothetical protein
MNTEFSEKKISFLATKISGFNNFLFWFGKKIYSFLLGLIFIVFVGAGVYTLFVGGGSISVPDFDDQKEIADDQKETVEENKKKQLEITKRKKEHDEMLDARLKEKGDDLGRVLTEEEFTEIRDEVWKKFYGDEEGNEKEETRDVRRKNIDDEYGDDIKDLLKASFGINDTNYELFVDDILRIPEDQRDSYFYGLVTYIEESYDYYSEDENYEMFEMQNNWETKWDIHNWSWKLYRAKFVDELERIEISESSAEATRMLSLQVMGGSFAAFLIVVLIAIFIQIEANTRPKNRDRT